MSMEALKQSLKEIMYKMQKGPTHTFTKPIERKNEQPEPKNKFEKLISLINSKDIPGRDKSFLIDLINQLRITNSYISMILSDDIKLEILNKIHKEVSLLLDEDKLNPGFDVEAAESEIQKFIDEHVDKLKYNDYEK